MRTGLISRVREHATASAAAISVLCPNCRQRGTFVRSENIADSRIIIPVAEEAVDEAHACHANKCWMAAAMLIRKTLDELCSERGATGDTLADCIKGLRTSITLPEELLEAADRLRMLGADAGRVDSKDYDDIGRAEVEAGLALTKELVKAAYRYEGLLARLRALGKPPLEDAGRDVASHSPG